MKINLFTPAVRLLSIFTSLFILDHKKLQKCGEELIKSISFFNRFNGRVEMRLDNSEASRNFFFFSMKEQQHSSY